MNMTHYLQGEFYRTTRRRYLYITFGVCTLLILAVYLIFFFSNREYEYQDQLHLDFVIRGFFPQFLPNIGLYATLIIGDMTFSEEHKVQTMRNTVFYGINRGTIFFGKFLNNLLFCILLMVGLVGMIFLLGLPLLGLGSTMRDAMETFWPMMLSCVPLWIGGAALATALYCNIPSGNLAAFSFIGVFLLPTNLLHLAGYISGKQFFYDLRGLFLTSRLTEIGESKFAGNPQFIGICWATGMVFAAIALAAGFILFRRKEIK